MMSLFLILLGALLIPHTALYLFLMNYLADKGFSKWLLFAFAGLLMTITLVAPFLYIEYLNDVYASKAGSNQCGNGTMGFFVWWLLLQIYTIVVIFLWLTLHIWQWWRGERIRIFNF